MLCNGWGYGFFERGKERLMFAEFYGIVDQRVLYFSSLVNEFFVKVEECTILQILNIIVDIRIIYIEYRVEFYSWTLCNITSASNLKVETLQFL